MASGSNKESQAGSGDETASSAGPPGVAAAAQGAEPGDDEAAAGVLPAAPTRPYYECIFCKRGFTTAQALGGHMNIHRRERAKPSVRDAPSGTTTSASASPNVECYNQYYSHHLLYPAVPPATSTPISTSGSFTLAYYQHQGTGASTGVVRAEASVNPSSASPRELSLFGAAARDRDLHGRGGDGSGGTPEGLDRQAGEPPESELDLELRLGRRPSH